MNNDMLLHQQVQQQQQEENMSNLTSASGDQASVSSGNRTEASGSNYFQQQQEQQQQFFVPESQPQKKRRNQPGNPGLCEKKMVKEEKYNFFFLGFGLIHYSNYLIQSSSWKIMSLLPKRIFFLPFCSRYHLYFYTKEKKKKPQLY